MKKNLLTSLFIALPLCVLPLMQTACTNRTPYTEIDIDTVLIDSTDSIILYNKTSSTSVTSVPTTLRGNDILKNISESHPGKIVILDIWATWCAPCKRAMAEMDKIKPELKKKGVVFVYLADERSPETDWQEAIQHIEGIHYRLTDEQMNSLNITGYPSYVVLDQKGNIAYDNRDTAGYPFNKTFTQVVDSLTQ